MTRLPLSEHDVEIVFVRSAGPGGQNVNKIASAAQLRFNVARYAHLDAAARQRLQKLAGRRLTDAGDILIIARSHRTQEGNRREAMDRLATLLEQARRAPVPRKATRPTRASKERRLASKATSSRNKQLRGKVRGDD